MYVITWANDVYYVHYVYGVYNDCVSELYYNITIALMNYIIT